MPKYRIIYKETVTLSGEAEADHLEEVFDKEIICLGPGSQDFQPQVTYISVEEIESDNRLLKG